MAKDKQAIHNNTEFRFPQDFLTLQKLKTVKNNWRRRTIRLYQHPKDENRIISVGESFDHKEVVICDESREDWQRELSSPRSFVETF